jgi:hypothetical protein
MGTGTMSTSGTKSTEKSAGNARSAGAGTKATTATIGASVREEREKRHGANVDIIGASTRENGRRIIAIIPTRCGASTNARAKTI